MQRSIAIFVALFFLGLCCLMTAIGMVWRFWPDHARKAELRRLAIWFGRGIFLPSALWAMLNIGVSFALGPFMPEVQFAKNSGEPWIGEYLQAFAQGFFVISSFWAAATVIWALCGVWREVEGENRADFKVLVAASVLGMLLPAVALVYFAGWEVTGMAALAMVAPIGGYAPELLRAKKAPPMYARAIAKLKFGKYREAEIAIINELEKREDDFEGWMMLADLYANNFNDLQEAEQTILEICDQPRTTPSQVSIALHRLADWYLKHTGDPESARRALQVIISRMPGTHLARMAQLRINQLPQTPEEFRDSQNPAPVSMPALGDALDQPAPEHEFLDRAKAREQANLCIEKLKHDPNNIPAREKLARLLTERLGQGAAGIEQLTLLLNLSDQPEIKRAEWLGTVAAWHLKYLNDVERGTYLLQRVIEEFPASPQALAAQRRLRLLRTGPEYQPPAFRIPAE